MKRTVPVKKFDDDKQIAFGEVYIPDAIDTQGDYMSAEEIEKIAYAFLASGSVNNIDTNHDLDNNGSVVIESFIARKGDSEFITGAWVMAIHVPDEEVWKSIKDGDLNGFSMFGKCQKVEKTIEIELPDSMTLSGMTSLEKSDGHSHQYHALFNESGEVVGGSTDEVEGHSHKILKESVTDEAEGHTHRFNILDAASF